MSRQEDKQGSEETAAEETRNEQMLNDPVEKLILRLAAPSIVSMLITSIYNIADTFFVSQLGTSASGAVGIIFSAMAMIQAISFMMGIGTGSNISRMLGAGREDMARRFVTVGWVTTFGFGCVISLLGAFFMHPIVIMLGATPTIAPYAEQYARFIFLFAPFMMTSFLMNNILRFQGLAMYSMVGITIGGILNIVLDPIFIFVFGLGTAGAGLATGLSQFISFCILFFMCQTRKESIKISPKNFRPSFKIYGNIFYTGMPSLARQGIASVSNVLVNLVAGIYGDAAIAALSIVMRCAMFLNSAVIGFGQGFQPVCAFNYGAQAYERVKKAFYFCIKVATGVLLCMAIICLPFSGHIIQIFRRDDAEVIAIGTFALRAQLCTIPLWGFYNMSNMLSQSIGYGVRASIIACARQGLFLIPMVFILPALFGIRGLQLAQPVSDICAFVLALILIETILKDLTKKEDEPGALD